MKIIGVAYHSGMRHIVLKSDSSLLNGRKPFFTPEETGSVAAHPCLILRIGRMGKHIEPRFAWRYIDGIAPGLHIEDAEGLARAREERADWTLATAMDGSLPVGVFEAPDDAADSLPVFEYRMYGCAADTAEGRHICGQTLTLNDRPEDVVALVSRTITLRQGDMVFIASGAEPFAPEKNNCIVAYDSNGNDKLFCKIK